MREAVILAGGLGTRLREVVADVPKPMAPVNGKPFLHYVLTWLENSGISRAVISAGYKSEAIAGYFGNTFGKLNIVYAIEEKPLGTGGALRFALRHIDSDDLLILNGDTYFPVEIDDLYFSHEDLSSSFTIALKRMKNFSRYGSVECDDQTIIRFNEKKFCEDGFINGGVYLAGRRYLEENLPAGVSSLEKDFLEAEAAKGILKCMVFSSNFIDIGIPEDYRRAHSLLKNIS